MGGTNFLDLHGPRSFTRFERFAQAVATLSLPLATSCSTFGAISSKWCDQITGAVVLINEGIEVAGLKIWGFSITPNDRGGFGPSTPEELQRLYDRIPDGTDVLITHGPPLGILDRGSGADGPQGCPQLLAAVRRIKPRIHVFGHVHQGYGQMRSAGTLFVNAALAEPGYALARRPISISIAL
jgi:hypothetical protein